MEQAVLDRWAQGLPVYDVPIRIEADDFTGTVTFGSEHKAR